MQDFLPRFDRQPTAPAEHPLCAMNQCQVKQFSKRLTRLSVEFAAHITPRLDGTLFPWLLLSTWWVRIPANYWFGTPTARPYTCRWTATALCSGAPTPASCVTPTTAAFRASIWR